MRRSASLILLAAVCLAVGAAATALAEGKGKLVLDRLRAFQAPPRGERDGPPPRDGKEHAGAHLGQAYDALTIAGLCERSEGKQTDGLLKFACEFYRTAHKAYHDGDYERAAETALAANDGARGILYSLKANAGQSAGLPLPPAVAPMGPPRGDREGPPPPRGDRPAPRTEEGAPPPPRRGGGEPPPPPGGPAAALEPVAAANDAIKHAMDRLENAPDDAKEPGRTFLHAAHKSLDLAKQAQKNGDSFKAVELARAAEAWSHVEEHLHRADGPNGDRPPPREERRGADLKRQPPMPASPE